MTKQSNPQGNPNPNDPAQQAQQQAQQAQQGQPLAAHHHQALKAAGVNWQGLPWQQLLMLAQALLAALAAQQPQAQAQQPNQAPASQP